MIRRLGGSLFGASMGFVVAYFPAFWLYLNKLLLAGASTALFLGMVPPGVVPEMLVSTLAVGVTAAIYWWETQMDGVPTGFFAGLYAALALVGAIASLFYVVSIRAQSAAWETDWVRFGLNNYAIVGAIVLTVANYFLCILQVRYLKCRIQNLSFFEREST